MTARRPPSPALARMVRRVAIAIGLVVGVLLLGVVIVLVSSANTARAQLSAMFPLVAQLEQALASGQTDTARSLALRMSTDAHAASGAIHNPIWQAAEAVPVVGQNFTAVRVAAEVADSVTTNALVPASGVSLEVFRPSAGHIDIDAIKKDTPLVDAAKSAVTKGAARLRALKTDRLVGPVASPVRQLSTQLDQVQPLLDTLSTAAHIMPGALGQHGERRYLLMVQNNADLRSQGGNPASMILLTADHGDIRLSHPTPGSLIPDAAGGGSIVSGAQSQVFGPGLGVQWSATTAAPEFAQTAQLAKSQWDAATGQPVDAVIGVDPVMLSLLLRATGPVPLTDGGSLTSANAVKLLLHDVYAKYDTSLEQDAYFSGVTAGVFGAVVVGQGSFPALVQSLVDAVEGGHLRIWSDDATEQHIFEQSNLAGSLPADTKSATHVAVLLNNATGVKLDYYLDAGVALTADRCEADPTTFEVTVDLTSTAPAAGKGLPATQLTPDHPPGTIVTDVAVYGPQHATIRRAVSSGDGGLKAKTAGDLQRPVAYVPVTLEPGATARVVVDFRAKGIDDGILHATTSPMVHSSKLQVFDAHC